MTAALLWAISFVAVLPSPSSPSAAGLAPGLFVTPHGCVASMTARRGTPQPLLPPSDPLTHSGEADMDDAYRGQYAASIGRYDQAANLYARALEETTLTGYQAYLADQLFRIPMSIALLRAQRVAEAKAQWQVLLSRYHSVIDGGTKDALAGNYQGAFADYAQGIDSYGIGFRDAGSVFNLQRGVNAAAQSSYQDARMYLGYSLECEYGFPTPHLVLGVLDAMNNDFRAARQEWSAALEGSVQSPITTRLSQTQADALRLLLRYD